jgi:hypothetical protein
LPASTLKHKKAVETNIKSPSSKTMSKNKVEASQKTFQPQSFESALGQNSQQGRQISDNEETEDPDAKLAGRLQEDLNTENYQDESDDEPLAKGRKTA